MTDQRVGISFVDYLLLPFVGMAGMFSGFGRFWISMAAGAVGAGFGMYVWRREMK